MGEHRKIMFILMLVVSTLAQFDYQRFTYNDFMVKYRRNYTGKEKTLHQQIFKTKYSNLLTLRDQGYDVVVNQFLDWTQAQMDAYFNYKLENSKLPRSADPSLYSQSGLTAPPTFDWRIYDRVTSIKDQSSCGACWAFSATAQYESLLAIATNGTKYDLAEQYAVQCDLSSSGCKGGSAVMTLILYQKNGVPLESVYPYNWMKNYSNICPANNKIKIDLPNHIFFYQNLSDGELEQHLILYGPFTVAVNGTDPKFHGAGPSGMISCDPSPGVSHVVLLVGYTEDHWIVKNSWGIQQWGDNGFGYIDKKANCNIQQSAFQIRVDFGYSPLYPNPDKSITVKIVMLDTGGDGWNGNIFAIKQNDIVMGIFGNFFKKGSENGPIYIPLQSDVEAHVVVYQLGTKTQQVMFLILGPDENIIYQRESGINFVQTSKFAVFCPLECATYQTVTYDIQMVNYDFNVRGWGGTVLALEQNGEIICIFSLGEESWINTVEVPLRKHLPVNIIVYALGENSQIVGFTIISSTHDPVFSRKSGTPIDASAANLGSFCPECQSLSSISLSPRTQPSSEQSKEGAVQWDEDLQNKQSYMIATFVLASLVVLLGGISIISIYKYRKATKKPEQEGTPQRSETNPSSKNISEEILNNA